MKRLALTTMCVLSVCAVTATSSSPAPAAEAPPATKKAQAAPEPEVRRFELTPVAPPTAGMNHHLLVEYSERIPLPHPDVVRSSQPSGNANADASTD